MGKKRILASMRYIVPSEMEYFLEDMADGGLRLQDLGQAGLFYFSFIEEKAKKSCFVVDISGMPKTDYIGSLTEKGWELMGRSFNCYIWRKDYGEQRPEDFSDKLCLRRHCLRQGIAFLLFGILSLAVCCLAFAMLYREHKLGLSLPAHDMAYTLIGLTQVPLFSWFLWAGVKLLKEAARLKNVLLRSGRKKDHSAL